MAPSLDRPRRRRFEPVTNRSLHARAPSLAGKQRGAAGWERRLGAVSRALMRCLSRTPCPSLGIIIPESADCRNTCALIALGRLAGGTFYNTAGIDLSLHDKNSRDA